MNSHISSPPRSNDEAGLSMVEIAIVVLVIAIVLAFAIPVASNSIRAYNMRSAATHMAERMAAVRALAMAKNRNLTFSFNNVSNLYGFDFPPPREEGGFEAEGDGIPDQTDPDDPSVSYNWETLPSGITATFPDNSPIKVTFNSRGEIPIDSTEQAIVLRDYNNRSTTVRVNLRGRITVE